MTSPPDGPPVGPSFPRTSILTGLALVCFALNSLLCRAALGTGRIDAASFTLVRLAAGAGVLWLLWRRTRPASAAAPRPSGRDLALSALTLFLYALPFSLAYLRIPTGFGAFLVFGCVQITMIGSDLLSGRRIQLPEVMGLAIALGGLIVLTRPGAGSPDPLGVLLMCVSGSAWGLYSIRGRRSGPALEATARNFANATPLALVASVLTINSLHLSAAGLILALVSGALTSGLGYVVWYEALKGLTATRASIVQLAVPPLAAVLGILFLGESPTVRLLVAGPLILGGIALSVAGSKQPRPSPRKA